MKKIKFKNKEYTTSKIVCVGKNYKDHIVEMGGVDKPEKPVIFIKPNSAISQNEKSIYIPDDFGLLHFEAELCFIVGEKCKKIEMHEAKRFIRGYAVGIDFTLRGMQTKAKEKGLPWSLSKGFDSSAVFGEFTDSNDLTETNNLDIMLTQNDEVRQTGNTSEMIFSCEEILSYASKYMTIEEGDIFMTGTPAGVNEVKNNDTLFAEILGLETLQIKIQR